MKHRHPNQAYSLSFYPDVLQQRLRAPLGWPRAVCRSHALEKLWCAAAAPQETGRMPRNKSPAGIQEPAHTWDLRKAQKKIPDAAAIEFPPHRPASSALCCLRCPSALCCAPLNMASSQRTHVLLDGRVHRELLFFPLLLHPFFEPQTPVIPADKTEANSGNPRHWKF